MPVKRKALDVANFRKRARCMDASDRDEADDAFQDCIGIAQGAGMRFGDAYQMAFEFAAEDDGRIGELQAELLAARQAYEQRVMADADLVDLYETRISTLQAETNALQPTDEACQGCHVRELCIATFMAWTISYWCGYFSGRYRLDLWWLTVILTLSPFIAVEAKGFRQNYHWVSFKDNDLMRAYLSLFM